MALSEFELKRVERAVGAYIAKVRPPPHIRPELDLGFEVSKRSVELFEIRPDPQDQKQRMKRPVAKATYKKTRGLWWVYWQRADLKWHRYEPTPQVESIEEFLALVEKDPHACFFG
jgi:Protein of unknown function (DUF3024)